MAIYIVCVLVGQSKWELHLASATGGGGGGGDWHIAHDGMQHVPWYALYELHRPLLEHFTFFHAKNVRAEEKGSRRLTRRRHLIFKVPLEYLRAMYLVAPSLPRSARYFWCYLRVSKHIWFSSHLFSTADNSSAGHHLTSIKWTKLNEWKRRASRVPSLRRLWSATRRQARMSAIFIRALHRRRTMQLKMSDDIVNRES